MQQLRAQRGPVAPADGTHRTRARELQAAYAGYAGERRAAEAVLVVATSRQPVG